MANDMERKFPVYGLSRADLKALGFNDGEVEALDDEDMQEIADSIGRFLEDGFLEEIEEHTRIAASMRLEFGPLYGSPQ